MRLYIKDPHKFVDPTDINLALAKLIWVQVLPVFWKVLSAAPMFQVLLSGAAKSIFLEDLAAAILLKGPETMPPFTGETATCFGIL